MADTFTQTIDIATIAAGDTEEREVIHGQNGSCRLEAASFVPSTTAAAHATDYLTLTLYKGAGGTGVATAMTTAATAMTKGTPRAFTMTENTSREFDADDVLEVAKTIAGGGAVLDGALVLRWRFLHQAS